MSGRGIFNGRGTLRMPRPRSRIDSARFTLSLNGTRSVPSTLGLHHGEIGLASEVNCFRREADWQIVVLTEEFDLQQDVSWLASA
ncbi:MAG: hypothetical protein JWP89_479 [Schlesneria sp.]|nr:hypothetical protein [Schlesneria sp.]